MTQFKSFIFPQVYLPLLLLCNQQIVLRMFPFSLRNVLSL